MSPAAVLALLQQAVEPSTSRDFLLYVADASALGAFGFAWRTNARLSRIETMLTEPSIGAIPKLTGTSRQVHDHASELQAHELQLTTHEKRLDGHDATIQGLQQRAMGPRDVGTLDRRGS